MPPIQNWVSFIIIKTLSLKFSILNFEFSFWFDALVHEIWRVEHYLRKGSSPFILFYGTFLINLISGAAIFVLANHLFYQSECTVPKLYGDVELRFHCRGIVLTTTLYNNDNDVKLSLLISNSALELNLIPNRLPFPSNCCIFS